jgi:LPS-assembly protein
LTPQESRALLSKIFQFRLVLQPVFYSLLGARFCSSLRAARFGLIGFAVALSHQGVMALALDERPVAPPVVGVQRSASPEAPKPGGPVFGEAQKIEGRTDRDLSLVGEAVVRRDGLVIRGDRITYYEADDEIFVVGNARLVRDGSVFVGKELRLKLDTNEGVFTSPEFSLPTYRGQGAAERMEFLGKNRYRFVNGYYTTCKGDSPAWCLRAESITIDEEQGEGRARSASLYFGNTKVLGLPVFFFPINDERKTGFLPASFSLTNRTGFEVAMPFYWNMAPNYDLTLTPRLMTKRGFMLGSQFRYLFDSQFGDLKYDHVVSDREFGGEKRYAWSWQHTYPSLAGWRVAVNYQGVSDDNYFIDYSRTVLSSATRVLPREITAARSFGDWNFIARYSRWQSILDSKPTPPYERVPQFNLTRVGRDVNGFDFSVLADATLFKRPHGVAGSTALLAPGSAPTLVPQPLFGPAEGWRAVLFPQVSYPIQRAGWFVTPKLGLHASAYRLESNAGNPTELNRFVPIFSLDAGMLFERETNFFGRDLRQTLEPRMFFVHSPFRDQTKFPIFDTSAADFNFGQLFATNTFVGQDRISDQKQLTTALVSRLIDPRSGAERFRFAFGQRLYFSPQEVQIPGALSRTDTRSDLLFALSASLENHWSLDSGMQYSLRDGLIPRLSLATRFTPPDGRILNAALRYQRQELGQIDTSWRWPVSQKWTALGRVNYSFLDKGADPLTGAIVDSRKGIVEAVAGFEYTEDCWVFRSVFQKYATSPTDFRTAFFFQIELSGVGRIGSDPFDILRRNIPGYRLPSDRIDTPSRFSGYQ